MPGAALVGYPYAVPVSVTLPVAFPFAIAVAPSVAVPFALDHPVRESLRHGESFAHRVAPGERQRQPRDDRLAVPFAVRLEVAIAIRVAVRDARDHRHRYRHHRGPGCERRHQREQQR